MPCEPEVGIEPTTCSLRESRSATELLGPKPAHGTSAAFRSCTTSLRDMDALAAQVWHYWLAVPLTIVTVLTVAKLIVGYVKTVTAPRYPKR